MTSRYFTDAAGNTIASVDVGGFILPLTFGGNTPEQSKQMFENVPNFKCRDDDVMLLSYPRTGTNWLNEVIMMLLIKSTEKPINFTIMTMLEFHTQDRVDALPSPRCLNTHLPYQFIPKEVKGKQLRTVLAMRNPKDTLVSFYNHIKGLRKNGYNGEWKDWFQLYMQGEMQYGMYTDYLKGYEKAMEDGIGFPIYVIHYEDLKQNGLEEVKKLAKFLGVDATEEFLKEIVDKCSFETMVNRKFFPEEHKKKVFKDGHDLLRKGQIGDWNNWFTEAQNEQFDQYWQKEMADSKIKFIYTADK